MVSRSLIVLLFFLSCCGCERPLSKPSSAPVVNSTPLARRVPGSDLRVASWNVRNFFDAVDDPNDDEVLKPEAYVAKLREMKVVLEALDADFLALQEVEKLQCLRDLNGQLDKPYPQLGLIEGNDTRRGIDVAFMSRIPVAAVYSHADFVLPAHPDTPSRYHFSRDCLEVQLDTQPPTTVLVNHFKSSRGNSKKAAAKRYVQAQGAVELAAEVDYPEGRAMVLVGDLNDRQDSWSLEPLFQSFKDAFAQLPKEQRVTHRWRKGGSAIDHILLDEDAAKVSGAPKIWKDLGKQTSDHDPVSIQMTLSPNAESTVRVWDKPGKR